MNFVPSAAQQALLRFLRSGSHKRVPPSPSEKGNFVVILSAFFIFRIAYNWDDPAVEPYLALLFVHLAAEIFKCNPFSSTHTFRKKSFWIRMASLSGMLVPRGVALPILLLLFFVLTACGLHEMSLGEEGEDLDATNSATNGAQLDRSSGGVIDNGRSSSQGQLQLAVVSRPAAAAGVRPPFLSGPRRDNVSKIADGKDLDITSSATSGSQLEGSSGVTDNGESSSEGQGQQDLVSELTIEEGEDLDATNSATNGAQLDRSSGGVTDNGRSSSQGQLQLAVVSRPAAAAAGVRRRRLLSGPRRDIVSKFAHEIASKLAGYSNCVVHTAKVRVDPDNGWSLSHGGKRQQALISKGLTMRNAAGHCLMAGAPIFPPFLRCNFNIVMSAPYFCMDSGASDHQTGNREVMNFYDAITPPTRSTSGIGGAPLEVSGYGYIDIGRIRLEKVLYVEGMAPDLVLVSVGQLKSDLSVETLFSDDARVVRRSDGFMIGYGLAYGSLYMLVFLRY